MFSNVFGENQALNVCLNAFLGSGTKFLKGIFRSKIGFFLAIPTAEGTCETYKPEKSNNLVFEFLSI